MSVINEVTAKTAASAYLRPDPAKLVRRTLWTAASITVLMLAALTLDGWLSVAVFALAALRALPWLFLPIASRTVDERQARLHAMCGRCQNVATTTTSLYSKAALS